MVGIFTAAPRHVAAYAPNPDLIGNFDGIVNHSTLRGWAINTNAPNEPVKIRFYFEKPKGQGGTELFFEASADVSRDDVRQSTGYPANHGFEVDIPSLFGDTATHTVYVYGMIDGQSVLLEGSPKTFTFYAPSQASLTITYPTNQTMVTGNALTIQYTVGGDKTLINNAHWRLDDRSEAMDLDFKGTFVLPELTPGKHTLSGYLGTSCHHDKVVNSDVEVQFQSQ